MKKLLLVLSVLAVGMFGFSSVASAGNCTNVNAGATYIAQQQFNFKGMVGSCTSVDKIEFGVDRHTNNGYFQDDTFAPPSVVESQGPGCITCTNVQTTYSGAPVRYVIYTSYNWCIGAPQVHSIGTFFSYRIESVDVHGVKSWGPWHWVGGGGNISCA